MISFTDQQRQKLSDKDKDIYEAFSGLQGILNWHKSGKTRAAEAYRLAIYQCAIAETCLEYSLKHSLDGIQNNSPESQIAELKNIIKLKNEVITELCKKGDHDMCILCNKVFPKTKPEPKCGCIAIGPDGRAYDNT